MIVLRLLEDHGELNSQHGQVMLGILVFQDLAVVVMVSVLPVLKTFSSGHAVLLFRSFATAVLFVLVIMLLASRVIPRIMDRVAQVENRDIFLLVALSLGLGVAVSAKSVGLSLSLGAFMAGLAISESEYVHEIMGKIVSLKDVFVIIFFVSIGMLINPISLFENIGSLAAVLAAVIMGKFIIYFVSIRLFGYHSRVAFMAAMGMTQIGEFSFVLARLGLDAGLVSEILYNLILASALISIVTTPVFIKVSSRWYNRAAASKVFGRFFSGGLPISENLSASLEGHVILCGYGRMGANVAWGLKTLNLKYAVVDYDYAMVQKLASEKIPYVYGDAGNEIVLEQLSAQSARAAIIALPDVYTSRLAIITLNKINPHLPILARAHNPLQSQILYKAGATEVVQPEAEAGFQMIRHLIMHVDISEENLSNYLGRQYYADYRRILRDKGYLDHDADIMRLKDFFIDARSPLAGKALKDSGIREKTGCNVVLIRRDGKIMVSPTSRDIILAGDILMMVGSDAQLKKFNTFRAGEANGADFSIRGY
jgi:CPA2 family monovalent cation:H+ antiporter-2